MEAKEQKQFVIHCLFCKSDNATVQLDAITNQVIITCHSCINQVTLEFYDSVIMTFTGANIENEKETEPEH